MSEKTEILQVRLSISEKASFEKAAAVNGLTVSAWARERLRREARTELQSSGQKVPFLEAIRIEGQI
ncbi:hypothetical protein PQU94_11050 [Asticcacaulis sp. DXS10W]|uniref:Uncharacterized protein n=1 Tax=Asticcacaulis currens TaxID=2984210 RepID=A0ABT5IF46_9CAUL|nr:hypothetical protein [Asticcacaulis currens]MDC7694817.1 hypothetical protein [Asticcacaulis currens]